MSKKGSVAIAILCKTPSSGLSKTRLSPPLEPEECAGLSACFIADLARTMGELIEDEEVVCYAVYTPAGSEPALRELLPRAFLLQLQVDGDFGRRLDQGIHDLLALGHAGAILINSDSPTLPDRILRQAIAAVRRGDSVVLSPAADGGYTLIGLSGVHPELFVDIPWSTPAVLAVTVARAGALGLPVELVEGWYDVDDAQSLSRLEGELALDPSAGAPRTRKFLSARSKSTRP